MDTPTKLIENSIAQARVTITLAETQLANVTYEDVEFDVLTQIIKDNRKFIQDQEWTVSLMEEGRI
jgi:hypothetical protein